MTRKKSIGKNSIIYSLKTVIGLLFPLISYPYVTRVMSVEAIGKVNFSSSIVSYFTLLSALGIYSFAVRTGTKYRDNREQMGVFASEIFTINIFTTIISVMLFFLCLLISTKWKSYAVILIIICCTIPLTTLGVDWLFAIYEDYFYITVRTIFVQIISIAFLFIFVKSDKDVYLYAFYTVFSSVGSNIFNIFRTRKYIKLHIIFTKKMFAYLKPMLVLFASTVATQIYLNSDITILGYLTGDEEVGRYNSAVKVYNIAKNLLMSLSIVAMPRLAFFAGNKDFDNYKELFSKLFDMTLYITMPAAAGVCILANDIMVIFAGSEYYISGDYLRILAISMIFSVMAGFIGSGCLVLFNKEKQILKISILSALINIILNFVFIPFWGTIVAATTTLISEAVAFFLYLKNIDNINELKIFDLKFVKILLCCTLMIAGCIIFHSFIENLWIRTFGTIIIGILIYLFASLILRKDMFSFMKKLFGKGDF